MIRKITTTIFLLTFTTVIMAQSCLPEGIYFSTQAQIDSFPINYPGCSEIEGDVTISGQNITNLRFLDVITYIGGSLRIYSNDNLNSLSGLDNLTAIGNSFTLGQFDEWNWGNHSLSSIISLKSLKEVGGNFYISDNSALPSLEGLDSLRTVGGDLVIQYSNLFDNLNGLGNLDTVVGSLMVKWNNTPISVDGLGNISSIGGLGINSNDSLTELSGLENIEEIEGGISIHSNPLLTDLSGLQNLEIIGGDLRITDNDLLVDLSGLSKLNTINGELAISENNLINNLTGLESLVIIGKDLTIEENSSMSDLQGMMNLIEVDGIHIEHNPSLKTFNSFGSLKKLTGDLWIMHNDSLLDFTGINQLDSIMGMLWIRVNPSLTSLNGLDNLTFVGDFVSIWGEKIETLEALSALHYIGNGLGIEHTDSLRTLEGLEGLFSIADGKKNMHGGGLVLIDNAALEDISALMNLTELTGIAVWENPLLESLSGLDHINPNGIISLYIEDNNLLSECEVLSICTYLLDGGDNTIINNAGGCNNAEEVIEACAWLDLSEEEIQHEIMVIPNPAESLINISLRFGCRGPGADCRMKLYDISGQIVKEFRFVGETQIDISHFPAGIYILEARTENGVVREKFIKR